MPFSSALNPDDPDIYRLLRQVRRALNRGDDADVDKQCVLLLERHPRHEGALNLLVEHALQKGDGAAAEHWINRGISVLPNSAPLQIQQGRALEAIHAHEAALNAFTRALNLDSNLVAARFYQGAQEEALGRTEDMLKTYGNALTLAKKTGMLDAGGNYSADVHARVNHAIDVIQRAREAALDQALAPLRAQYGKAELVRIERMLDVYLGKAPVQWPHPLQRPTFMLIPDLPAQAWFERETFPFLKQLEDATQVIREELLAVLSDNDSNLTPYVDMPQDAPAAPVWRELNRSARWSSYHLFRHGQRIEEHCRRCPKTAAALEALPIMRVPDHSPEALFSVLKPHTHIPTHTGVVNGRLTVHLPLIVPKNCGALKAGEEARSWEVGKCLIFDDSMFHEAWNDSDQTRVVLIFDIWNPYLTEPERAAMAVAVATIGRFNRQYCASNGSRNDH